MDLDRIVKRYARLLHLPDSLEVGEDGRVDGLRVGAGQSKAVVNKRLSSRN